MYNCTQQQESSGTSPPPLILLEKNGLQSRVPRFDSGFSLQFTSSKPPQTDTDPSKPLARSGRTTRNPASMAVYIACEDGVLATKRPRGNVWEFVVRRKKLLDKPLYLTFEDEAEGDAYCEQLERLLDQGIVPAEVKDRTKNYGIKAPTFAVLAREYISKTPVSDSDVAILDKYVLSVGGLDVRRFNHEWADEWVTSLKRERKLAPSTIRHHVGAFARLLDYGVRQNHIVVNPLRSLRKGYATYSPDDELAAGMRRVEAVRDERLSPAMESAVIDYLGQPDIKNGDDLKSMFTVGIHTGMRLSEIFTLRVDNVHVNRKLVRLVRTKNGTTRDVPLSTVAIDALTDQLQRSDEYVWPWYPVKLNELELERPGDKRNPKDARIKTTNLLSTRWDRVFKACGADGYTFHYLRHEAASRIFEGTKMPDRAIMKMFGWKTWEMVDRYSHLRASTLADYLD